MANNYHSDCACRRCDALQSRLRDYQQQHERLMEALTAYVRADELRRTRLCDAVKSAATRQARGLTLKAWGFTVTSDDLDHPEITTPEGGA